MNTGLGSPASCAAARGETPDLEQLDRGGKDKLTFGCIDAQLQRHQRLVRDVHVPDHG